MSDIQCGIIHPQDVTSWSSYQNHSFTCYSCISSLYIRTLLSIPQQQQHTSCPVNSLMKNLGKSLDLNFSLTSNDWLQKLFLCVENYVLETKVRMLSLVCETYVEPNCHPLNEFKTGLLKKNQMQLVMAIRMRNRINPIIQRPESECGIRNYIALLIFMTFQYTKFLRFDFNLILGQVK